MTILTLSDRGVLTLPAKLRKEMGLGAGQPLIAEATAEGLLLRPAVTLPVEIYTADRIREFDEEEARLTSVLAARPGAPRRKSPKRR